jgi:hypothetical protein
MGSLIGVLPFSAGYAAAPSIVQLGLIGLVVGASAFLGWRWGDRFLDSVSRALDSIAA